jgi:hypothetical protein
MGKWAAIRIKTRRGVIDSTGQKLAYVYKAELAPQRP